MAQGRIREKGLQTGLLKPGMNYPNKDVAELIFESGLSTTSSLSEISGRGVGNLDPHWSNAVLPRHCKDPEGPGSCINQR